MRRKTEFQIHEKTHRSGNKSFVVSLGKVNGKRKFKPFETREEAQLFKAKCEEREALKNPTVLGDLDTLGAAAIRHALEKLKPFDASITEAVDFFIKFAKPPKGKITIQEAMDSFKNDKEKQGLSKSYISNSKRTFFAPFRKAFQNKLMNDVTPTEAHRYIYNKGSWNKTTKNSHIRHLRALYSFVIDKGHATMNPFRSVPFAKDTENKITKKVLSVANARTLLQFALDNGYKAECASLALNLFCGIRVDEVERVQWEFIDLDGKNPFVDLNLGKNSRRRVNRIPPNAVYWLRACRKKRGPVAPQNYVKAMQRLRRRAGVPFPQNAARHSFASYHIALYEDAAKTAVMLGHPNPTLLYNTYRQRVTEHDAAAYWQIVPDSVIAAQKRAQKKADEEARSEAEAESNIGKAIRDEDGVWRPVMDNGVVPENALFSI